MPFRTFLILLLPLGCLTVWLNGTPRRYIGGQREITVFAAASLTEAFQEIAKSFEASNQNIKVVFNFAGSQQLVQQVVHGASVDVLATANGLQMAAAVRSGNVDGTLVRKFAHNHLVIVLPAANEAGLASIADLSRPNVRIVLADKSVPAGQYALDFLDRCSHRSEFGHWFRENVIRNVVSYEENVKAVLSKVLLCEADAGIVYSSDITERVRGRTATVTIPESLNVVASYQLAVSRESNNAEMSDLFVNYILSEKGQAILARYGFNPK